MSAKIYLFLATLCMWEGLVGGASLTTVLKRRGLGAHGPMTVEKTPAHQWEPSFKNDVLLPVEVNDSIDHTSHAESSGSKEAARNSSASVSAGTGSRRDLNLTVPVPLGKSQISLDSRKARNASKSVDSFRSAWFDYKAYALHRKLDHTSPYNKTRFKSLFKSIVSSDPAVFTLEAQERRLHVDHNRRLNLTEKPAIKPHPNREVIAPPQREVGQEQGARDKTGWDVNRKQHPNQNNGQKSAIGEPQEPRRMRVADVDVPDVGNENTLMDLSQNKRPHKNVHTNSSTGSSITQESQNPDLFVSRESLGSAIGSPSPVPREVSTSDRKATEDRTTLVPQNKPGDETDSRMGAVLEKEHLVEQSRPAVNPPESSRDSLDPRSSDMHDDSSHLLRLQPDMVPDVGPDGGPRHDMGQHASPDSPLGGRGLLFQEAEDGRGQGSEGTRSRSRRSWIWNQFFVIEEYTGPEPVLIGRLRTDMDRGDGRTKYMLRGEGAGSVFVIDEKTGNIHVTKPLDREEKDEYRLIATATDRQTERALEPSSQFIIRVQDINDNPPIFQEGPYSATIPEMANIGTSIIQVTATDADDPTYGNSARLVYTLTQGQEYFSVDPQTGILRTAVPDMDRETQDQYLVVLQAKDMGGHLGGLSGTTTVTVWLSDVNDNPPRFTQTSWSFSVSELALPGAEVGRLSATDPDLGENAKLEFSILDSEGGDTFNITGLESEAIITLNKAVDYESRRSYSFSIEVLNPLVDPRFLRRGPFKDRAAVRVQVLDADEPPRFARPTYLLDVYENCPPPCPVGRVDAVDPDTGLSSSIRYSIDPQTDPETLFRIAPDSGLITTATELDREFDQWHNITVIATQRDNPSQVTRVVVAIETLDVNDNAPELDRQYSTVLCDSTAVGEVVQELRAVDMDQGGNDSTVHFSIAPESRAAQNFCITETGGPTAKVLLLSPLKTLPRSPASSITMQVPVVLRDSGSGLSSTGTLTVSVCPCLRGVCLPMPSASPSPGLSTAALLAILACVATLLAVSVLSLSLRRQKRDSLSPLEEDDVRENIITYDDEGGGEADTAAFDIAALQSAPQSGRRGYRTLDSKNIRYSQQNREQSQAGNWAQNAGPNSQYRGPEASPYGPLRYSCHTLPVLRAGRCLGFPTLHNSVPDKPSPAGGAVEAEAGSGDSDSGSTRTGEPKDSSDLSGDSQRNQDWPIDPRLPSPAGHSAKQSGVAATGLAGAESNRSVCDSQAAGGITRSYGEDQQGEALSPAEGTMHLEVEGGISVNGTACSLYQEGLGFIADWRNRAGVGAYTLERRDMIPQILGTGQLGYIEGRGLRVEAGGGGQGSLALKVGEFLRVRLAQVTFDPSVPPYDSVQVYGFEGTGSLAGSLSSLESEGEESWGVQGVWGAQFQRLVELIQERRLEREREEGRQGAEGAEEEAQVTDEEEGGGKLREE
uniref:Cadherin 24 n=1 Tax=Paramormyrops kingsleyae TaxID=1676925 RepID=A0A3B3T363_9TELE|nr:cadherin-11-like [Paramormyrops kingsleyae]